LAFQYAYHLYAPADFSCGLEVMSIITTTNITHEVIVNTINLLNRDLITKAKSAKTAHIIQPVQIGHPDRQNELVFFIKPELLSVEDDSKILNSLTMIEEKMAAFHCEINGIVILPGNVLANYQIMNRHYGFINQLSRKASTIIDEEIRQEMFKNLEMKDDGSYKILGGHEFLQTYPVSIEALSELWFGQGARKLRSGFYFIADTYQGDPILLVNGFHPAQLRHFTREDHLIILMLIHTDTDWYDLKFELVGDTFPAKAKPGSIRGQLFADQGQYGQDDVGINTNGVHLSAGPFEAAYEVVNFFGDLLSYDPHTRPPLAIQRAIEYGIKQDLALSLLENPAIDDSDLFSETENLNTDAAIKFAQENLLEQ